MDTHIFFIPPFISCWTLGLIPFFWLLWTTLLWASICADIGFHFSWVYTQGVELLALMLILCLTHWGVSAAPLYEDKFRVLSRGLSQFFCFARSSVFVYIPSILVSFPLYLPLLFSVESSPLLILVGTEAFNA